MHKHNAIKQKNYYYIKNIIFYWRIMGPIQIGIIVFFLGMLFILLFIMLKSFIFPKKISHLKAMVMNKNYKGAVKVAREILSKDKNNMEAHFYLGECYFNQNKNELALLEYKAADKYGKYTKNVTEKMVRERLADLYLKFDNIDEALKEYLLLVQTYHKNFLYYYKIGFLFQQKNMRTKAANYYVEAIKRNPTYVPALNKLALIMYETRKFPKAKKLLKKVQRLDPTNKEVFLYLGLVEKEEKNFTDALKHFEKALQNKEQKLRALLERGLIYMMLDKYNEAIMEFDRGLKNSDEENNITLNIRYFLAACYENQRTFTDAIAQWEKIYSVKPTFKDVAEKLANYQDLRMDDKMKDFMTATKDDFLDICTELINKMGLDVTSIEMVANDFVEIESVESDNVWRNVMKKPKLIQIFRKSIPLNETAIRKLVEKMKKQNIVKGYIISSSSFTSLAQSYAKGRPIELIDKEALEELLEKNL